MGFTMQERRYISNGNLFSIEQQQKSSSSSKIKMVNNFVQQIMGHNNNENNHQHYSNQQPSGFLQHFRSWQRSRKMKLFSSSSSSSSSNNNCVLGKDCLNGNKNSSHHHLYMIGNNANANQTMINANVNNNLCYQSFLKSDLFVGHQSNKSMANHEQMNYYCTTTGRQTNNSTLSSQAPPTTTTPIVSFMNKGDGKIALNLKNLNDNQLYSMDILPKCEHNKTINRCSSDFSCYVSLEPPPPPPPQMITDIQTNDPLTNESWYYGSIEREQATELIDNCPTGSFVVRRSLTKDGCYALTIRVPYDYNHTGISHYLILKTDDGKFKIKGFQKEFQTICSLITHHSIMKEQLPCTLRLIKYKFSNNYYNNDNNNNSVTIMSPNSIINNATNNNNNAGSSSCSSSSASMLYLSSTSTSSSSSANHSCKKPSINVYTMNNSKKSTKDKFDGSNRNSKLLPPYDFSGQYDISTLKNNDHERMVDIDMDPTYQRILENFRKTMAAHCN